MKTLQGKFLEIFEEIEKALNKLGYSRGITLYGVGYDSISSTTFRKKDKILPKITIKVEINYYIYFNENLKTST